MAGRNFEAKLSKIRKKLEACDDVIYVVGTGLFRESALKDMKFLMSEVESCRRELGEVRESLQVVTGKLHEELKSREESP
jgi:NifB/MoaA-like Fe-S oxidoreductase